MNVSCVCVSAPTLWHVLNLKDTSADPVHYREIFISCSRTAWPMKGNYGDIQPWPILPSESADLNCHVITSRITHGHAAALCLNTDKQGEPRADYQWFVSVKMLLHTRVKVHIHQIGKKMKLGYNNSSHMSNFSKHTLLTHMLCLPNLCYLLDLFVRLF